MDETNKDKECCENCRLWFKDFSIFGECTILEIKTRKTDNCEYFMGYEE